MNAALTEKLYATFPYLYRGHTKSPIESSMCYGFDCADGWYPILYELSWKLSNYLALHPSVDLEVMQVKNKFGNLRFYVQGGDAQTEEIISHSCQLAVQVSDVTGKKHDLT